jgi:hypothetical protein
MGQRREHHNEKSGVVLQNIREVGLEVNTEQTKYIVMSRHRNARQSHFNDS